eukprot:g9896.t1
MTSHDAGFSDFVGPFAYRLACVGQGAQRSPRNLGDRSRGPEDDSSNESEEGFCDNGDVGSGEKLLHLLQKWDVRHRMLMVTRIDGGFMMAELMGVRRYKFVIDRAKKLLENTDLASLRRAVDIDIHPPTTAETGGWDRFVIPISARRRISGHLVHGNLLGAPRASGGALIPPPCNSLGVGVGVGVGRGARLRAKIAVHAGAGSTRTRARRILSLGQLSISSKTVPFPRGHVPSVMGAKGHGKKRGRINHFAVRTPPPSSWDEDGPDTSPPPADALGRQGITSGWSLSHELDPTSTVTDPHKHREGSGSSANNCSVHTASRVSTCDTINSPSRLAAIMLGVTGVHTALPPPYGNISDRDGSFTSEGFSRLETASSSDVDTDASAMSDSHRRPQPVLPGMGITAGHFTKDDNSSWAGGAFRRHPVTGGGAGDGMAVLEGQESSSGGAWPGGHEAHNLSGTGGCVVPASGGGVRRGVDEGDGAARPLLHRVPGSGVRDEPPPSLVVVPHDGGRSRGRGPTAAAAPLSNGSTMGRWKSDDDGGGCSTISSATGGGGGGGGAPRNKCDTPATWRSDDLADLGGIVSGRSDPPPTRSKSALRGWSVDRTVPACSPLVTQKRGTESGCDALKLMLC